MRTSRTLLSLLLLAGVVALVGCTGPGAGTAGGDTNAPIGGDTGGTSVCTADTVIQLLKGQAGEYDWQQVTDMATAANKACAETMTTLRDQMQSLHDQGKLGTLDAVAVALLAGQPQPADQIAAVLDLVNKGGESAPAKTGGDTGSGGGTVGGGTGGSTGGGSTGGGDTGGSTGGASSLGDAIGAIGGDNVYTYLDAIQKACGGNVTCTNEFDQVVAAFQATCASATDCSDPDIAILLFKKPTAAQEQAGICPATSCVQIGKVKTLVQDALSGAGAAAPSGGEVGGELTAAQATAMVAVLNKSAAPELSWNDLNQLFTDAGCKECLDGLPFLQTGVQAALDNGSLPPTLIGAATDFVSGNTVQVLELVQLVSAVGGI